jgi:hypothetical protein
MDPVLLVNALRSPFTNADILSREERRLKMPSPAGTATEDRGYQLKMFDPPGSIAVQIDHVESVSHGAHVGYYYGAPGCQKLNDRSLHAAEPMLNSAATSTLLSWSRSTVEFGCCVAMTFASVATVVVGLLGRRGPEAASTRQSS